MSELVHNGSEGGGFTKPDSLVVGSVASNSDTDDRGAPEPVVSAQAEKQSAVSTVGDTSQVLAGVRRIGDWVRASWLYQWLTKEPEPDVIVIDLRETDTVGPVIHLLDALIERATPYWEQSRLKAMVVILVGWMEQLAETRAGQLAMAVLAPPEPPEEHANGEAGPAESTSESTDQATGESEDGKTSQSRWEHR